MKLYDHQEKGVQFLMDREIAVLNHGMGLGKSGTTITAADKLNLDNVLFIEPAVARINMVREIATFSGRSATAIRTGTDTVPDAGWVVTSYDLAAQDTVHEALCKRDWDAAVIDEMQLVKTPGAGRTQKVMGVNDAHGIVEHADRVWCLSGTPTPNHVGELWPFLSVCLPHLIPRKRNPSASQTYRQFLTSHCQTSINPYGGVDVHGNDQSAVDDLYKRLAPFWQRRMIEDVALDLPPIRYNDVPVEVDPSTLRSILELETDLPEDYLDLIEAGLVPPDTASVTTTRRIIETAKVDPIVEQLEAELEDGAMEKVVVFGSFLEPIKTVAQRLKRFGAATIIGSDTDGKRQARIDAFQNDPKVRVLVIQIIAGGTALTLHAHGACRDVVFLGADWVPANNAQAAKRVHRIGQPNGVRARFFYLAGSVDEKVQRILTRKVADNDAMYGDVSEHHAA